jgi:hypothetical protein
MIFGAEQGAYAQVVDPAQSGVLWVRRPIRQTPGGWAKYAEPRWHRLVTRDETQIAVACRRPLPLTSAVLPAVPNGAYACRHCLRAAEPKV